jgi:putative oxidoreductase
VLKKILLTDPQEWATLPLRLVVGLVFMAHGAQKLFGWLGGKGLSATAAYFAAKLGFAPGLFWAGLAGSGEFLGGLLVILGLATRVGACFITGVMVVAIVKVHRGAFFLPGGMEFALVLLGVAVALIIKGGGRFSLDGMIVKRLK